MGSIKYGKIFFIYTTIHAISGIIISKWDKFAAFKIAFATVFELSDIGEYFGIFKKKDDQNGSNHNWTNYCNSNACIF